MRVVVAALASLLASTLTAHARPPGPNPSSIAGSNTASSVPSRAWRAERIAAAGAVDDAAIAEREALHYLADHLPDGATLADFVVVANQLDGDLRTVAFQQTWRGLRIVDATFAFVFGRSPDGDRLFAVKSRAAANVDPPITAHPGAADLVVIRRSRGWEIATPPLAPIMYATATLKYNAGVRYPLGARSDYEAVKASITVDSIVMTTSATGTFSWTGTAPASVVPAAQGTYVRVLNTAGTAATGTLTAQPGGTAVWNLDSDELGDAQVSTYVYASRAKARARIVNPALATWLDTRLDFYVNENGDCQAYSNGDDVHLSRGQSNCENTGRLADVVFHEFGHSVHKHSVITGVGAFESHLSEGLADFFAANMTEDPGIGRGFFFDDGALRDIDPPGTERVYPADLDFNPHVSGLIISGALWDMRKALIAQLGYAAGVAQAEKIFTGVMQRADEIGTTFDAALVADDDNANLADGTPNFCVIENAFGRHGLVPGYDTTTVSLPVVDGMHLSVTTTTPSGTTCPPPAVQHVYVTWKAGDGVASVFELAQDGAIWSGDLPEQPTGTVVAYSFDVQFDDGTSQVFPNNPADPLYQVMAGVPSQIWCERMDADPMWMQTSNAGIEWEWAAPIANPTSGDPSAAKTGSSVLGTDITLDGNYRANLLTSITTPAIDVSRFEHVHLQYWRWLTVEDGRFDRATVLANGEPVWRNLLTPGGNTDHVDREWRFHDIDVTPNVHDGAMQITWSLATDADKELGGWTLDDVCLVGLDHIGRCGDLIVEEGEQCDDGGTDDGDGCNHQCILEPTASGGGGCAVGGADYGWLVAVISVLVPWRRRSRLWPS